MTAGVCVLKLPLVCRPAKKFLHASLHTSALVCVVLAVIAAILSHTLKRPTPIPNFYSAHSWLGLATLMLLAGQVRWPCYRALCTTDACVH